jgi:ATP/maltotriose-dependent transcriptional regulator MalT
MIYRLLAEQVYAGLDDEERSLLEVAVALPVIDVDVLERAGFDRALTIVERLRERTAFVHEESPGVYQCHDLFRDFLRHQTALGGKRLQHRVHERAARALEQSGDFEYAITSYATAGLLSDVLRLLEEHGFDLLERARGDVVAHAIEALDERTRRENAAILALQGILQSTAGRFSRAESLLRRALSLAGNNRDLVARVSLRLASLMANEGRDVADLLGAVGHDGEQHTSRRVQALSLIAGQRAVAGDDESARLALAEVDALIDQVDSDAVRAKVLHHIGIAFHHLGMPRKAFDVLAQSTEIAGELHLYSVASRANAVLSNLALHEQDDVDLQLYYAEAAEAAAAKAGDAFAQQTALLQTLSARMRRGEVQESIEVEQRLATVRKSELAAQYLALFRSLRLAWEGRFAEAQRLAASCWAALPNDFDKVVCGGQYALFLAINGERELSGRVVRKVLAIGLTGAMSGLFRVRSIGIAKALCSVAEAINHRNANADRILRGVKADGDEVLAVITKSAEILLARLRLGTDTSTYRIRESLARLTELGYADVAGLLAAVHRVLSFGQFDTQEPSRLTATEVDILRLLAEGFIPKEIALRKDRSVYTIRVHIANAIAKLGCHGRAEAISMARRLKLI